MAIAASDYFIPRTSFVPYILEDIYIKGGFRVFATLAARDDYIVRAKQLAFFEDFDSRKIGMLCSVIAENRQVYQLNDDKETWSVFAPGGDFTAVEPLFKQDGSLRIREAVLLPTVVPGTSAGSSVVLDNDLRPVWGNPTAGTPGSRSTFNHVFDSIDTGQFGEVELVASSCLILLRMAVNVPDLKVEIFSTPDKIDNNPYTFISTDVYIEDEGIREQNGVVTKFRRFSILANLEVPVASKHYIRVTNVGPVSQVPVIDMLYLDI
jgi:hypothetical protein